MDIKKTVSCGIIICDLIHQIHKNTPHKHTIQKKYKRYIQKKCKKKNNKKYNEKNKM